MTFDAPIEFSEATQYQAVKQLLPTLLTSKEISKLFSVDVLKRSMFAAQCADAGFLQRADDVLGDILNPHQVEREGGATAIEGMSLSKGREQLKAYLASIDYQAPEGKAGTIEDLSSDARLNLIVKTNVQFAQGYGQWKQGQTPAILDQYPCQELYRREERKEPRDWPARWSSSGGGFYGDGGDYGPRMIARKDDPIWVAISAFGIPYAPFDFNSGMDLMDVDRDEAIQLGVIDEDDDSPEPDDDRDFNDDLAAGVDALDSLLSGALLESVGDLFGLKDGLLSLLNEAGVGCLMARMPDTVAAKMLEFARKIDPETLVANEEELVGANETSTGVETWPHVTICHGFKGVTASDLSAALSELAPDPIVATLGRVTRFPGSGEGDDSADVLVVSVESPMLEALHQALVERFSDRLLPQEHEYRPHATLARVKPGTNLLLDGDDTFLGTEVTFNGIVFSQDDVQQALDTAERLNEMVNEDFDETKHPRDYHGKFARGDGSPNQTTTPEFKQWFGDWQDPHAWSSRRDPNKPPVSVVVENGKPLVLYHATTGDFSTFDPQNHPGVTSFGILGTYDTQRHGIFAIGVNDIE